MSGVNRATNTRSYWEDCVSRQLAWAAGLDFVDLREYRVSPGMLRKIDADVARSRRWVPMIFNTRRVVLLVDDPAAPHALPPRELTRALGVPRGRKVEFAMVSPSALSDALERYSA